VSCAGQRIAEFEKHVGHWSSPVDGGQVKERPAGVLHDHALVAA
jgi:hypothetical protein